MPPSTEATPAEFVAIGAALASSSFLRSLDPAWFSPENAALVEWLKKPPAEQKGANLLDLWLLKHGIERGGGKAIEDIAEALKLAAEFSEARKMAREIAFGLAHTKRRKRELIERLRKWGANGEQK